MMWSQWEVKPIKAVNDDVVHSSKKQVVNTGSLICVFRNAVIQTEQNICCMNVQEDACLCDLFLWL